MANSICEAKYIAASNATKEAVWLRKFLDKLGVAPFLDGPVPMYCDNTGAIAQAKKSKSRHCTKHILRCYHLVREIMERGELTF